MINRAFRAALPLLLSGCTELASPPSLAPRAVEHYSVAEPQVQSPEPVVPVDASRAARIAALLDQARAADTQFREAFSRAEAVRSGAQPGTEQWVQAQQALSRAAVARAPLAESIADLDALALAAAQEGAGPAESETLAQAIGTVTALDENARFSIERLSAQLGPN